MFFHDIYHPNWNSLTQSFEKYNLFSNDFHFEFSSKIVSDILGPEYANILKDYALLLIKPEALLLDKVTLITDLLKKHHFELVFFKTKTMTTHQTSEIWKYIWSAATFPRIISNQALFSGLDSCILILKNQSRNTEFACSYLCQLKGHSDSAQRSKEHFRSILVPLNSLLNHIHTADEPADLIRESSILLEWQDLIQMYTAIKSSQNISFNALCNNTRHLAKNDIDIDPQRALKNYIIRLESNLSALPPSGEKHSKIQDIISKLKEVSDEKLKITTDTIYDMVITGCYEKSWDMSLILTSFIEYQTHHQAVL